jgi:hypothetical protein
VENKAAPAIASRFSCTDFIVYASLSVFEFKALLSTQGLIQWQICLIYLDNVIVYSKNFEEHVQRLDLVLERIVEAGLKLKSEKCEMLRSKVVFLGHVISEEGSTVTDPKWHCTKFVKTIFCRKGSFGNIQRAYGNLMVPAGQIKGGK